MTHPIAPSHAPYGTLLWKFIQIHFELWLSFRKLKRRYVPAHIRTAIRNFLRCGDPAQGFKSIGCPDGHFTRYAANRCKGRGFCIRCLLIRQRDPGTRLIDRVFGNIPVRHLVFCFPPAFRFILGFDKALLDGGFTSLARAVFNHQRNMAMELFAVPSERIHPGCIEVAHRASSTLVTNHHIHGLFADGVFIELDDGTLEFRRLPRPSDTQVATIAYEACLAFCAAVEERGFWKPTRESNGVVEGVLTLPNARAQHLKFFGQAARDSEGGTAPVNGAYAFHLFVGNAIEAEDRPQLEHLVNYILAPPFLDRQISVNPAGNLVLRLKRPMHDGTAEVELEPFEALDRIAELVPRRHANTVRYYGIYAPRSKLRSKAIALCLGEPRPPRERRAPPTCPICGKVMRVIGQVKPSRDAADAVPPDTPEIRTPPGQDRIEAMSSNDGQGRLFCQRGI